MAMIGVTMVVLTHAFGHPYIDGVGYGVIQAILDQDMTVVGLLALLFVLKLLATTVSLGCGASGGIFSPSLYLGATLGAGFALALGALLPYAGLTVPSAAIVGMAAMVGAGTGAVMTAIIMVFEMTRDYAIIVPVIVAVAVAAGVRRALIGETIYTVKLRHRGHRIPKERHVNLYLVKQAQDVMERRFLIAEAGTTLKEAIGAEKRDDLPAIIVARGERIVGLISPALGPMAGVGGKPGIAGGRLCRPPPRALPRHRPSERRARAAETRAAPSAAIVVSGADRPRVRDVVGVITKRAIADTVIDNFEN